MKKKTLFIVGILMLIFFIGIGSVKETKADKDYLCIHCNLGVCVWPEYSVGGIFWY